MKIEKTSNPLPTPAAGEAGSRASAARSADNKASTTDNSGTSVHLGSTTTQLRSMESSIASSPMVDAKKVTEIKQAISEGRFKVNSGIVADRLINSVQDLITASKR
jgi:negative regulator of flagellin synthesis FlgM